MRLTQLHSFPSPAAVSTYWTYKTIAELQQ
jgi:hypothetical protein